MITDQVKGIIQLSLEKCAKLRKCLLPIIIVSESDCSGGTTRCRWVPCIVFKSFIQVFKLIYISCLMSRGPLWLLYNRHWLFVKYAIDLGILCDYWAENQAHVKFKWWPIRTFKNGQGQHLPLKTHDKNEGVIGDDACQVLCRKTISNGFIIYDLYHNLWVFKRSCWPC